MVLTLRTLPRTHRAHAEHQWQTSCPSHSRSSTGSLRWSTSTECFVPRSSRARASTSRSRKARRPSSSRSGGRSKRAPATRPSGSASASRLSPTSTTSRCSPRSISHPRSAKASKTRPIQTPGVPGEDLIDVTKGEARLRFQWLLAKGDPPALLTDLVSRASPRLAERGTGSVHPRRLELTQLEQRGDAAPVLSAATSASTRRTTRMVFDEATLALPIVKRNAQLLAVLLPGLEAALAQDEHPQTLADDASSSARRCAGTVPPSRRCRSHSG